jgi:hypothetical protein
LHRIVYYCIVPVFKDFAVLTALYAAAAEKVPEIPEIHLAILGKPWYDRL